VIQHIVLFTPKPGLDGDARRAFASTTLSTLRHSPDISRFTVGRRVTVDAGYERSLGADRYDYAAVLEFENQERLVRYLRSADHEVLGRLFWEACERTIVTEVTVVDPTDGVEALVSDTHA
jgi:Stress responsive A/B Barrel Domain